MLSKDLILKRHMPGTIYDALWHVCARGRIFAAHELDGSATSADTRAGTERERVFRAAAAAEAAAENRGCAVDLRGRCNRIIGGPVDSRRRGK